MVKKIIILSVFLNISLIYSQKLKTIEHEKYEIKVPENWEENKMFYSNSLSLTIMKPKSDSDMNPVEAIGVKHVKSKESSFEGGYIEYISFLKGYYKENFKILETENLTSNNYPIRKLIVETKSRINGKKRRNIMVYSFKDNESMMLTLTGTKENFDCNLDLYAKVYESWKIK
ncbi:hypothetical protein [Pseudotamlana agarivorans]|uniref:hypothetical protein n=1 Tax=Pseudotamlana agarivorans TaxID=481183 RepID=UPI0008370F96|nr:hypothetical protein [Tamlana agarivorans]